MPSVLLIHIDAVPSAKFPPVKEKSIYKTPVQDQLTLNDKTYVLNGFIERQGAGNKIKLRVTELYSDVKSCHYVAYVKCNSKWLRFSEKFVNDDGGEKQALGRTPYLAFYCQQ